MGRGRGKRAQQHEEAEAREALERAWRDRLTEAPELAALVVARSARREPFHRWMAYRQGFAPELVRRFLDSADVPGDGPVLDPFSGSGTVATECARQGRAGLGGDVVSALSFCAAARGRTPPASWAPPDDAATLEQCWEAALLDDDVDARAAVLHAAAAAHDGEGHRLRNAPPPHELIASALATMNEDAAAESPPTGASFIRADARRLPLADDSVAGVLTSPPYLSRYDYARVNDPTEKLYAGTGRRKGRRAQMRASKAAPPRRTDDLHPAMAEAADRLSEAGQSKLAAAVSGYAADGDRSLAEIARVLQPGAPLWFVVAGADLKRVYVPADLVFAERCAEHGLRVESVDVARLLRGSGRRLGGLSGVAPREVVIRARKRT